MTTGEAALGGERLARRLRVEPMVLFAVLVGLNLADLFTTQMVLRWGGQEGNPLMAPIIANLAAATAVKLGCLAVVGVLIARCTRVVRAARIMDVVLAVNVWYLLVVAWNVRVLIALS